MDGILGDFHTDIVDHIFVGLSIIFHGQPQQILIVNDIKMTTIHVTHYCQMYKNLFSQNGDLPDTQFGSLAYLGKVQSQVIF